MREVATLRGGARAGGLATCELEPFFRSMRARVWMDSETEGIIPALFSGAEALPAGRIVLRKGDQPGRSMLVLDGMLCRFRDFPNGGRQVTALHMAGDFVDLASFTLPVIDQDVLTLTRCRVAIAPHSAIKKVIDQNPDVTRVLWTLNNLDAAIFREWELSLGQRTAVERMAHLFCELHARLRVAGLADGDSFSLPLTQVDLSHCLGLSAVHTNRVLRELRERQLMHFARGRAMLDDLAGLRALAGFDPAYLHLLGGET